MFVSQILRNATRSLPFYYNVNLQPISKKDYWEKIAEYNKAMAHYSPNDKSMIKYGDIDMKTYEKLLRNSMMAKSILSYNKKDKPERFALIVNLAIGQIIAFNLNSSN